MNNITTNTGAVEYNINGVCTICFNPTDSDFIKRLHDAFDLLENRDAECRAEIQKTADTKKRFEIMDMHDTEMRGIIDGLFNAPVCDAVFGTMNVFAMASGSPVWKNLMNAVMSECGESCE